eukprot:366348-Chlamydomonas_euryale.AAC.9
MLPTLGLAALQAKKEGNAAVVTSLETVLRAAFEAKQSTLRVEIQLLNRMLAADGPEARHALLDTSQGQEGIAANDRYFFTLVDRMQGEHEGVDHKVRGAERAARTTGHRMWLSIGMPGKGEGTEEEGA